MKNKKYLSIKTQFKEALSYLKETKNYIYISIFIFLLGSIFGFLFSSHLIFIDKYLAELIAKTADLNTTEMVFFILQNNLQSSFFSILFGIFLGIFPLLSNITNGVVLGYVLAKTYEISGFVSWWRLIPHGIFELPAIFISFGLGVKLGFSIFFNKKTRIKEFKRRFYNSINTFLIFIIPLLILAAIIEGLLIGFLM
ncbi:MAG: stage II sporulation protein M [Nanoarchaeota archaeon]|nr:stage II sporulation protein M [Nanoarchaeota archaeon]